jgi:cobalamin biosynthetic protein CobC
VQSQQPTGAWVAPGAALGCAPGARGGWLVVDEAFGDTVQATAWPPTTPAGLIVLRSVGKFFGLAGLRLGFVAAAPLLDALADWLGPWTISGPAQQIGGALGDRRGRPPRCRPAGGRSACSAAGAHGIRASGTALFQWWPEPEAQAFHAAMAQPASGCASSRAAPEASVSACRRMRRAGAAARGLEHMEPTWLSFPSTP